MVLTRDCKQKELLLQTARRDYLENPKYYYPRPRLHKRQLGNQHQGLLKLHLEQLVVSAIRLAKI